MPEENQNIPTAPISNTSVLDKPVPNPLAKNPNVHTHKVFAAVGLILIGVILVLFGAALIFKVDLANLFTTPNSDDNTLVSTPSAKPKTASVSATVDETAGWKIYNDNKLNFEIKHPTDWIEDVRDEVSEAPGHEGEKSRIVTFSKGDESILVLEGGARGFDGSYEVKPLVVGEKSLDFYYYTFGTNLVAYNGKENLTSPNNVVVGFMVIINKNTEEASTKLVKEILSTFKFL